MKTTTLLRSFVIFVALAIFAGCSKDNLPVPTGDNFAKSIKISETDRPYHFDGSISGMLSPVPSIVTIKLYDESGFSVASIPKPDGSFLIENLNPGLYNMGIYYVVQHPDKTYPTYFDIWKIEVLEGKVTDLGVIVLPWN